MKVIPVIFDFSTNVHSGINDFKLILPVSCIPDQKDTVHFDVNELVISKEYSNILDEDGGFFGIESITWFYKNGELERCRVFVMPLK